MQQRYISKHKTYFIPAFVVIAYTRAREKIKVHESY